jgi:hypothetical protein
MSPETLNILLATAYNSLASPSVRMTAASAAALPRRDRINLCLLLERNEDVSVFSPAVIAQALSRCLEEPAMS